jgi:curved DNA-binding protein CbpA
VAVDLYALLQVDASADAARIRTAYRALAAVFHPDHAGADGEPRMREINAAWEVLGDAKRRAAYDAERRANRPPDPPAEPSSPPWTGRAGPPPGRPSGSIVSFGIFAGWSLGEIARTDPGYLEWLEVQRAGIPYLEEIDSILRRLGLRSQPARSETAQRGGRVRFRR